MTISSASRGRGTGPAAATISRAGQIRPLSTLFRIGGGLPCAAVAGVTSAASAVREAPSASVVVPEARPIIVSPVASAERSVLARFHADLQAAPELAGELVALYVEQHPQLTLRFVAVAVQVDPAAAAAIAQAARCREAYGLRGLALVLLAALALVAPIEPELDTPPVIVDIGPGYFDDDFPW